MRSCYVATYPLNSEKTDLVEQIVLRDTWYSPAIRDKFNELIEARKLSDPMVQCWYSDENGVRCMATTNQPFHLD
jgi:hypothetical protein